MVLKAIDEGKLKIKIKYNIKKIENENKKVVSKLIATRECAHV